LFCIAERIACTAPRKRDEETSASVIINLETCFDYTGMMAESDFGRGLNAVDNLAVALTYAGDSGVVYVFNWSDKGDDEVQRDTFEIQSGDNQWQALVKGNIKQTRVP